MKYRKFIAIVIITSALAAGCGIFPKEEILPEAPVIPALKIQEYDKVSVMRGDVIDSKKIVCSYQALKSEKLSFEMDGVYINHVYVKEGDKVQKGKVLADLDMGDTEQQIDSCLDEIELLKQKLSNEKELKQLIIRNRGKLQSLPGYGREVKASFEVEIDGQEEQIQKLSDDLEIAEKRLEKLKQDKNKFRITADMGGVVASVADYKEGDTSSSSSVFIQIYDPDTLAFVTRDNSSELFEPGQEVSIQTEKGSYKAVADLRNSDTKTCFRLEEQAGTIGMGEEGVITLIRNERKNVFYLPSKVVYEEDGQAFVYIEDENGIRGIKEVDTGLAADNKIEIIAGLREGDQVILN